MSEMKITITKAEFHPGLGWTTNLGLAEGETLDTIERMVSREVYRRALRLVDRPRDLSNTDIERCLYEIKYRSWYEDGGWKELSSRPSTWELCQRDKPVLLRRER